MDLLIEDGILLKRYHLPWRPSGWEFPPGWTPDTTDPSMRERADALLGEGTHSVIAMELALQKLEREYRENPQLLKRPWPGWVPVGLGDKDLQHAYRELVRAFNPGCTTRGVGMVARTKWPPDGRYEYAKGKIGLVVSLGRRSVFTGGGTAMDSNPFPGVTAEEVQATIQEQQKAR